MNLRETEVERLREKIHKMEHKIYEMVAEKDTIIYDFSNLKDKYELECQKNKYTNGKLEMDEEKIKALWRDLRVSEERGKETIAVSMPETNDAHSSEINNCHVCQTIFNTESELKNHQEVDHKGNENFKCDICSYKTNSSAVLVSHIVTNHCTQQKLENSKGKETKQSESEKTSSEHESTAKSKEINRASIWCVKPSKPSQNKKCSICGLESLSIKDFEIHMIGHTEDGDFACNECSYQTNTNFNIICCLDSKREGQFS